MRAWHVASSHTLALLRPHAKKRRAHRVCCSGAIPRRLLDATPHTLRRRPARVLTLRAQPLESASTRMGASVGSWAHTMRREDERGQTVVGQLVAVLVAHAVELPEALVYAIVAGCEVLAEHKGVVMAGRRHVLRHHSCAQSARRAELVPIVLHAPAAAGMHAP